MQRKGTINHTKVKLSKDYVILPANIDQTNSSAETNIISTELNKHKKIIRMNTKGSHVLPLATYGRLTVQ